MRRTITWLLYIFTGVQIIFGCAYFVTNFSYRQQFAENCALPLPAGVFSFVQLAAAGTSLWYFLGEMGLRERKFVRGWLCAFLLTVPYLLQMHMAMLVWSLSLSAFLWMFGLMLEILRLGCSGRRKWLLAGAYFLYGIVCPDGLWLGGILLLSVDLFCLRRNHVSGQIYEHASRRASGAGKKGGGEQEQKFSGDPGAENKGGHTWGRRRMDEEEGSGGRSRFLTVAFVTAAAIFLANAGLNRMFPDARRLYRENNPGTAAVSRFVWPNFASNYFFWDEEVKAVLSEEDAVRLCQRIDLLEKEFYPAMREAYGSTKATKLCLGMGYRCLMDRSRETVAEIARDLADHLLIPFTIEKNLRGEGVSLTAWNYGRMKAHTPILVKYYYRYGLFELPILLLGSLLLWSFQQNDQVSQWMRQRISGDGKDIGKEGQMRKNGKGLPVQWRLLLYVMLLYTLWYTMRSNLPIDYKLVLPILFVWYLASVGGLLCQRAEN